MWVSSVRVLPHQFSSQTSIMICSRRNVSPACVAGRSQRLNSFGATATSARRPATARPAAARSMRTNRHVDTVGGVDAPCSPESECGSAR